MIPGVFSVEDRDHVRDHVLEMARADPGVGAGAVVGALGDGSGDRWSDLDLTVGVADRVPMMDVLADWTRDLADELDAVHLFDLPSQSTIYRVFLMPSCLQVDLSFTPASEFGARGPRFTLLFGCVVERPHVSRPSAHHLFELGVHHAVRARISIERGRWWQAEYWINSARDEALSLACRRLGLNAHHGRGYDDLPVEVLDPFGHTLASSVEREELLCALDSVVAGLLRESAEVRDVTAKLEAQLRELASLRWT